jgi:hypothetical protein
MVSAPPFPNDTHISGDFTLLTADVFFAGGEQVASPKAMNYEGKEPETEKGAREAPRTEVSGEQHLFVQVHELMTECWPRRMLRL